MMTMIKKCMFLLQVTNAQIYITTLPLYIMFTPTCFDISVLSSGCFKNLCLPKLLKFLEFFFYWRYSPLWVCILQPPSGAIASSRTRFLDHTQRRVKVGRTPLDEWSFRRRDLYLTTHNTHNRQTSMPPVGFKPTISAAERPKTYALDRAATGTGKFLELMGVNITIP